MVLVVLRCGCVGVGAGAGIGVDGGDYDVFAVAMVAGVVLHKQSWPYDSAIASSVVRVPYIVR